MVEVYRQRVKLVSEWGKVIPSAGDVNIVSSVREIVLSAVENVLSIEGVLLKIFAFGAKNRNFWLVRRQSLSSFYKF